MIQYKSEEEINPSKHKTEEGKKDDINIIFIWLKYDWWSLFLKIPQVLNTMHIYKFLTRMLSNDTVLVINFQGTYFY